MDVLLISTYELGRQPFGLASAAAHLRRAGAIVECLDLSRQPLRTGPVRSARFIAFYVPMHTATRLALAALPKIRKWNPTAHLCFFGLYAPVNEAHLRSLGAQTVIGGEFEAVLVSAWANACRGAIAGALKANSGKCAQPEPVISLEKQKWLIPERQGLPDLSHYAHLQIGGSKDRVVGYTEASRGCKHRCRHCPVVPVYKGHFRVVSSEVVLEDIRRQVAAGAQHITFGDPDFFNGPRHALEIVRALHHEHPALTYDVTIKIEHLLQQSDLMPVLRDTGCLFVTSAVESVDNQVLSFLDKDHTYADFVSVVKLFRETGLVLSPTFVPFTPWTSVESYRKLLRTIADLDLIENVAPIQLAIRLLVPAGSRLLELAEISSLIGPFDSGLLMYHWSNPDPAVDRLSERVQKLVQEREKKREPRQKIFRRIWNLAHSQPAGLDFESWSSSAGVRPDFPEAPVGVSRATIPYLEEPWYC